MIQITLPDGSVKAFEKGATPMDVAKSISEGLARNVISASFNGTTVETVTPLSTDGSLVLYTWRDDEGKQAFWHSSAHVLAQAIEEFTVPGIVGLVLVLIVLAALLRPVQVVFWWHPYQCTALTTQVVPTGITAEFPMLHATA